MSERRPWKVSEDQWVRAVPLTPEELSVHRAKQVEFCNQMGSAPEKFTCDGCGFAPSCKLAFDGYNTDGDCLYEK